MEIVNYSDRGVEDDEFAEEMRERYANEVEDEAAVFVDEPGVCHNVYPDSDNDEEGGTMMQFQRGEDNLFIGQAFYSAMQFKETMLDYALKTKRNIKQTRYDKTKLCYECAGTGCSWRIYCSTHKESDKWIVRSFNENHSCFVNGNVSLVNVPVIASMFLDKIREEPKYYMPIKIEEMLFEKWGVHVSRPQCQAARNKALKWIEKDYDNQFNRLKDYSAEITDSNPGSSVIVESNMNEAGVEEFSRFYVCFDVLRRSWKATCRPLIGVDACFMKGKLKGQLFVAIGRDGNKQIYPIAWAVAQVENTVNWLWFVKNVKKDLSLGNGDGYIIVSDRQKGLIRVVELELPRIENRMCVRHIYANIKSKHGKKTQMKPFIWNLAWSYNEAEYRSNLGHLMAYDIEVYEDVLKESPHSWCRVFYGYRSCCEDVENNSTESFNNTILKAREKPLVHMLNIIARHAMVKIMKRKTAAGKHEGKCTPYAEEYLSKTHEQAMHCSVYRSTNNMFQVVSGDCYYRVNMDGKSCSCRRWEITGMPCQHVYAVIMRQKGNVENNVAHWFKTEKWRQTYEMGIIPMRGASFWPNASESRLQLPPNPAQPGRKKLSKKDKQRKKGVNESPTKKVDKVKKRVMHCLVCGAPNHNSRFHKDPSQQGREATQSSQVEHSQGILTQDE